MTMPRPKPALISLAVLGVLLTGCSATEQPGRPAADVVTSTPAADDPAAEATPTAETPTAEATAAAVTTTKTPAPAVTTVKPRPKATTSKPSPRPTPKPTTKKPSPAPTTKPPSGQQGVHPGAFCAPEGAIGYTSKGTRMRCTRKAGEDRARWRAA
jgi:outer membrane biosynthesis protein TonB